jgi:hypothetical protein
MPRPHKPSAYEIELQRKIDTLSTKLLQVNAAMRLKVLYAERLEIALHQRNERIDQLFAQLQSAWQQNRKLEAECEHLAQLIAGNSRSDVANESITFAPQDATHY